MMDTGLDLAYDHPYKGRVHAEYPVNLYLAVLDEPTGFKAPVGQQDGMIPYLEVGGHGDDNHILGSRKVAVVRYDNRGPDFLCLVVTEREGEQYDVALLYLYH